MVDVDSTIYPLLEAMATCPGGERVQMENVASWNGLPDLVEGGVPGMLQIFDQCMSYEKMRQYQPFPGAVATLQAMAVHGATLHIMTSRKPQFADGTRRWLSEAGVPIHSFLCDLEHDKLALCKERGISVLIDDHPELLAEAAKTGLDAHTLAWPYNASAAREHGLVATSSWHELGKQTLGAVERRMRAALQAKEL